MPDKGVIGQIVRSVAGRDAKRVFAVVGIADDTSVLVADGKLRKLASPKKKNLRHLRFTGVAADIDGADDWRLSEILKSYEDPQR